MTRHQSRSQPYALKQDQGWTYRFGIDFVVKSSEIQEGSGAAVLMYVTRKGEEPPDHTHPSEDEMFFVVEGAITFRCGVKSFDLERGDFMFLPCGIQHGYTIQGDEPVQLLVITAPVRQAAPGGWGGFVADMENGQGELIGQP